MNSPMMTRNVLILMAMVTAIITINSLTMRLNGWIMIAMVLAIIAMPAQPDMVCQYRQRVAQTVTAMGFLIPQICFLMIWTNGQIPMGMDLATMVTDFHMIPLSGMISITTRMVIIPMSSRVILLNGMTPMVIP